MPGCSCRTIHGDVETTRTSVGWMSEARSNDAGVGLRFETGKVFRNPRRIAAVVGPCELANPSDQRLAGLAALVVVPHPHGQGISSHDLRLSTLQPRRCGCFCIVPRGRWRVGSRVAAGRNSEPPTGPVQWVSGLSHQGEQQGFSGCGLGIMCPSAAFSAELVDFLPELSPASGSVDE